ncbi:MAG: hypothetical protein AAGC68_12670 [Verrucomicrobiota bacterium]
MPDPADAIPSLLDEFGDGYSWFDEFSSDWVLGWVRNEGRLAWMFRRAEKKPASEAETLSVRQRSEIFTERLGKVSPLRYLSSDTGPALICPPLEGEPFDRYLERLDLVPPATLLALAEDCLDTLLELSKSARILSNVAVGDFFIVREGGLNLRAVFCPGFSVVRTEIPLSDFQLTQRWVKWFARLQVAAKIGWHKADGNRDSRPFRALLKRVESGKSIELQDALHSALKIIQKERNRGGGGTGNDRLVLESQLKPRTVLCHQLRLAAESAGSEDLSEEWEPSPFSPFVLIPRVESEERSVGREDFRRAYLLPPDSWFHHSILDPLHRKMAHSFAKSHHNAYVLRSLYGEPEFTLYYSDFADAVPLVSLLHAKDGLKSSEAILMLDKFDRACDQFEGAGFGVELTSPWQIELAAVSGENSVSWVDLFSRPLGEWPAWDIRIRFEPTAETFLEYPSRSSWDAVNRRLGSKFFPALAAWLLDWSRWDWATREGCIEEEPFSRDERMKALFDAANDFFDPAKPRHRRRLLELITEGAEAAPIGRD